MSANRCFAFGYFFPVNSKKALAGIRQRWLSPKCLPSERKLKTEPPLPVAGYQLYDAVVGSPYDRRGVAYFDIVGLRHIEFGLMRGDTERQVLYHLAVFGVADVLFIIVAHRRDLAFLSMASPSGTGLLAALKP